MDWAWTLVSADTIGGLVVLHMKILLCGICFSKGIGGRLVTATCGWLKVYLAEWHGLISTLFIFLYIVWVQSLFQCQCLGLIPELYGTYQLLFTALFSAFLTVYFQWRLVYPLHSTCVCSCDDWSTPRVPENFMERARMKKTVPWWIVHTRAFWYR